MLKSILEYLEESIKQVPDKTAYADECQSLTFREVYDSSRAIGTGLAKRGYFKTPAAILMDSRHIPYIQATLGILYAGCFYAPLDAAVPQERLDILLERLEPAVVLYDEKNAHIAKTLEARYDTVSFEQLLQEAIDQDLLDKVRSRCSYYDLACVMFTSGSTGIPKWVTHTHSSLHLWCLATTEKFGFTRDTVVGNQSPFFYSNSIGTIYVPICLGASSYILSASVLSFPKKMVSALKEQHVSDLTMTPSSYTAVADAGALENETLPELKWMILSGEACNSQAMKKWLSVTPNGHVWNFYGSTEALAVAVMRLDRKFEEGTIVPVGPVYDEVHMVIVDEYDEEVPYGEKGEMLIHTPWMSCGYYKDAERTKEAFVDDPLNKGYHEWFYRTGDLAYFNERDELVVTGRKDNMIKHKGYRMELGEVEVAAKSVEGCMDCCCIHVKDKDMLYCFYTGTLEEEEMNKALRHILPKYALPDRFMHIDQIPYTPTVKADRKALSPLICE